MNRRMFLLAGTAALGGCTAQQIAQAQAQWANFIDDVNQLLAAGCSTALPAFTATANTIEAVVLAIYPALSAAVSAGAAAVQAVAGAICRTVPSAPPAQLSARLRANTARHLKTTIGNVTINGRVIPVTGYAAR